MRAQAPEWERGLEMLEGPVERWFPLGLLCAMTLYAGLLRPLLWSPSSPGPLRWRLLLAPLLGALWAWLTPRLRKAGLLPDDPALCRRVRRETGEVLGLPG